MDDVGLIDPVRLNAALNDHDLNVSCGLGLGMEWCFLLALRTLSPF
jgi:hypothetical protein